jgi:hypothetical protein
LSWLNLRNSWLEPWIQSGSIFISFKFILYIFFLKGGTQTCGPMAQCPSHWNEESKSRAWAYFFFKKNILKGLTTIFWEIKQIVDMSPIKVYDVSFAISEFDHHSGVWKIMQLVFCLKNLIFKLFQQKKKNFINTLITLTNNSINSNILEKIVKKT